MRFYKDFTITGVINTTTWEDGIQSTDTEKKRIIGILVSVSAYQDNVIKCNVARKEVLSTRDYVLDTYGSPASTNVQYATSKTQFLELDVDLPIGDKFQIGITCGATATNVKGCYIYELI